MNEWAELHAPLVVFFGFVVTLLLAWAGRMAIFAWCRRRVFKWHRDRIQHLACTVECDHDAGFLIIEPDLLRPSEMERVEREWQTAYSETSGPHLRHQREAANSPAANQRHPPFN